MSETIAKIIAEQHAREFSITPEIRSAINVEKRTVELSFSSEAPVPRWYGNEILSHDKGACDLKRIRSAGPLLLNHDPEQQVGVIESCEIDAETKKGRAVVRFSKSALGQEIFQDVQDGIRSLVSVGYRVREMELMKKEGKEETYRATKWEPLEISIVSIPADTSVGVGRSNQTQENNMNKVLLDAAPATREGGGGAPAAPATPQQVNVAEIRAEATRLERERQTNIRNLCTQARMPQLTDEHIARGSSVDDVRVALWEKMTNAKPLTESERKPELGLTEKEIRQYSLVRALNLLANKKPLDGFELECSQGVADKTRRSPEGFFIPHDVIVSKRAMNVTTATQGGFLVDTELQTGSMIELLRNATVFNKLGARNLSGLVGNVAIPRVTGGATAYWVSETTAITESTQAIGQLALTPKKLGGYTQYTKQLLAQSSIDVESFVRSDLMTVLAIEKDRACINGLGAAGEPLGVLNTTGIGSVTFGAAATWAKILSFESAVEVANALNGKISYLTTPATKAKWKAALKVAAVSGFLWENGDIVNGYPAYSSNQVPSDKVIFGNFGDFITADWDGMDVTVDPYSLSTQGLVKIVIFIMTDNGARHAVSFVASTDSGAQ